VAAQAAVVAVLTPAVRVALAAQLAFTALAQVAGAQA
jgi:hypothetical protein